MITKHWLVQRDIIEFVGSDVLNRNNAEKYMQEGYLIVTRVQGDAMVSWYNKLEDKYEGIFEFNLQCVCKLQDLDANTNKSIIKTIMDDEEVEELHDEGWWNFFTEPEENYVEFNMLIPYNVKESSKDTSQKYLLSII